VKVAIVGYGIEGEVSAWYWHNLGNEVTVCDQNIATKVPPEYTALLGDTYLDDLIRFDVIVRTAGMHPRIILAKNPDVASKVTTNIEEFMRVCPTPNIVGVTGTKGKGTTTTLIAKMLEAAGLRSHIGGNIGIPPLQLLTSIKPADWVVLELSSFQLEDFKGPSPHIGVCVMVVPEHLNWHATMDEDMASKGRLFAYQKPGDIAIYYGENQTSLKVVSTGSAVKIPAMKEPGAIIKDGWLQIESKQICHIDEFKLPGRHNWQNICAATTTVWQIVENPEAIKSVLTSFSGLDHRIQFVRELDGISYYDDSYATTPETAIAAMEAFTAPKILILGGSDKGIPLDPMTAAVPHNNVRHVIAIGDMGETIAAQLRKLGFESITTGITTMPEMIKAARMHAQDGDVVLLSTGCASFDLFENYQDRGNQFKAAVRNLS
jgi:UDP-N-acetylmuramoylalanine--D-glutamate ligase